MKVNIENCAVQLGSRDGHDEGREYTIKEMIGNLKELRDRTAAGDLGALDEFFGIYVFIGDEGQYQRDESKAAQVTAAQLTERITETERDVADLDLDGAPCPECGAYLGFDEADCMECGMHFDGMDEAPAE